jgi:putative alpha-1,2-mannosidase
MEAKNASGVWAGPNNGWTEGDKWAYTFDVVHDIPGLIQLKGGNRSFVDFLDEHFTGGREFSMEYTPRKDNSQLTFGPKQIMIIETNQAIIYHICMRLQGMPRKPSFKYGR